jgi:type I restriction enzyme S subunit
MKKSWQTKPLGDVAEVGAGNSAPQDESLFKDGTYPFFRTADAGRVRFGDIYESTDYLNEKGIKGLRRYPKGTILFPKSGASTFLNHRVMLGVEGCVSSHLATIVADETQIEPRFLLYFLSTISAQDLVQDHAYPSLNLPTISGISIQAPPLPEQQRISSILDEAFAGIATAKANAGKNLQNARALFDSNLQSAFTQRGNGWVEKTIADCFKVRSGDFLPAKAMVESGSFNVYGGNGINGRHDQKNLSGENIIIGRVGAKCGNVHHVEGDAWVTDNALYISEYLCPFDLGFLTRLLRLKDLRSRANQMAQPVISYTTIKDVSLEFPPSEVEQEKISSSFDALEVETQRLASTYERKLAALDALKKSLLHQAFTGEL